MVLLCCLTLLIVAAWLSPDSSGMGTHTQLGHPPCTWPMLLGYPCPTCGMTTAFAHTVRGELPAAFHAQPAGLVLALGTIVAAVVSLGVLMTGRVWVVNWYRVSPSWVPLGLVLLILVGWGYKLATGIASGILPLGR